LRAAVLEESQIGVVGIPTGLGVGTDLVKVREAPGVGIRIQALDCSEIDAALSEIPAVRIPGFATICVAMTELTTRAGGGIHNLHRLGREAAGSSRVFVSVLPLARDEAEGHCTRGQKHKHQETQQANARESV
jgi:hypothetical protein